MSAAGAVGAAGASSAAVLYSVILPTYNERQNLPLILSLLSHTFDTQGLSYEVVVVDDNSPDRTWEVTQAMQRIFGHSHIVRSGTGTGTAPRVALHGWVRC